MIITCPYCQTRYQVADQAIGGAGRKVQCANCREAWRAAPVAEERAAAPPPEDRLFTPEEEAVLDEAFARAAMAVEAATPAAGPANGPLDPGVARQRHLAMRQRQRELSRRLPVGRIRRAARVAVLGALVAVIGGGIHQREAVVRALPEMAAVYAAVGLGVNVLGLEFRSASTLRTLRDGSEAIAIRADIVNVAERTVQVPPVLVSLVNDAGATIYEWSVTPQARALGPNEMVRFETQLVTPPADAERVILAFMARQGSWAADETATGR